MAVRIRLMRLGKKKRPYYRIVVTDQRNPNSGTYIESLGYYHPIEGNDKLKVDLERYNEWIGKGATPSDIVRNIVKKAKKLQNNEQSSFIAE